MVLPKGTTCPSGEAIAAELDRLDAAAALAALGSPEITIKDTKMHVVLRGPDGSILGTREVAAPEACHERATVAAVFIAAWVGEWTTAPMAEDRDSKREASNHNAPTLRFSVPGPRPTAANPASKPSLISREQGQLGEDPDIPENPAPPALHAGPNPEAEASVGRQPWAQRPLALARGLEKRC